MAKRDKWKLEDDPVLEDDKKPDDEPYVAPAPEPAPKEEGGYSTGFAAQKPPASTEADWARAGQLPGLASQTPSTQPPSSFPSTAAQQAALAASPTATRQFQATPAGTTDPVEQAALAKRNAIDADALAKQKVLDLAAFVKANALGESPTEHERFKKGDIQAQGQFEIDKANANIDEALAKQKIREDALEEQRKSNADYSKALIEKQKVWDFGTKQHQDFLNKWANETKDVKDPAAQYWGDKTTGSRIMMGLSAFVSGVGQGMLRKGGNPVLDMIQHEMDKNFEAHRDHIRDLYEQAVESGKIVDSNQNEARWMDDAKLHHDAAGTAWLAQQLDVKTSQTLSKTTAIGLQKIKQDLLVKEDQRKYDWTHSQALLQQQAGATARADQ